ncbi:MAG: YjeF-like protein family sugar kinase [Candidatus Peregrinibacteria bacterium GW2011_GWF2_33_10]|nr:MAG: YjeF-like protein family sugar kinase [Candidatus Peregrinibacteria bacterium GW2011_GWF2_33_10]OGJ44786.1 MAG: NAD(P)H-hydrate dehydratase [Candidatus Peregrinibacteria bacterium RIFOXYA2_FULL_33_21]OGJ46548.1 MAG: NAD(P)H-hydrate dehydratase [Candidatus Peregrinibacteria bacterium RIFOXYA12_FULL_33_12]OGJ50472.1 MAG: NAD(P)H-hydrate dehydratase [Candidatus Peregrinibacteria bacterium RIFOXYB2_FULL_33_20]
MKEHILSKYDIRKIFPYRNLDSHKGDNGRVCIIGGSIEYYGAPIFAGLGAVHSGADLVYIFVPESNFDCSRSFYPDFIVRSFAGEFLTEDSLLKILELANKCDVVLVGPGLSDKPDTIKALRKFIPQIKTPVILDADALKVIHDIKLPYRTLLTPHHKEFEMISGYELTSSMEDNINAVQKIASALKAQIILKGQVDIIAKDNGEYKINKTGSPGMTVGGSGDVLAGFIAGIVAQGATLFEASCFATFCLGTAAEVLETQKGYAFSATDLALEIPYAMKKVVG